MKLYVLIILFITINPANLVVFSYNRPLQLYSFLESAEKNISGTDKCFILYRSDKAYANAYKEIESNFPSTIFIKQQNKNDFKPLLVNILNNIGPYVIFAVDDIIVRKRIDLNSDKQLLEKTKAYGFYYRLGKNITFCYPLNMQTAPPNLNLIKDNAFSFKISDGKGDWGYPNSVDMVLVRSKDVKNLFSKLNYKNPNNLEGKWSEYANYNQLGLCYEESAIVNFPLNIVGEYKNNRNAQSYSAELLLQKFNDDLKIDIEDAAAVVPCSPHMVYEPKFIPRD
jgi:hypothetical protein